MVNAEKTENGVFALDTDEENNILRLMFVSDNTILKEKYYIFQVSNDDNLMLMPCEPSLKGYVIKRAKPLLFSKILD